MADTVSCTWCGGSMLLTTALKNNGLCARCAKIPLEQREAQRQFERDLASGALFVPSADELASACVPAELRNSQTRWTLQPDYYAENPNGSVPQTVEAAKGQVNGHVFLVSGTGGQLNFGFTRAYAVLEYQNEQSGARTYARGNDNLTKQVEGAEHVNQACPCCGVGMLWYPSRCHMPRFQGFRLLSGLVCGQLTVGVTWMDLGDISYVSKEKG